MKLHLNLKKLIVYMQLSAIPKVPNPNLYNIYYLHNIIQELQPSSPHPLPNITTSAGMSLVVEGDGDSPKSDEDEHVKLSSTSSASYHCHNEDRVEPESSWRITPNTQILGSLMKEINRRFVEEKKSISDGGDSPKSHPRNERTISNYREVLKSMNSSDSEHGLYSFIVVPNLYNIINL